MTWACDAPGPVSRARGPRLVAPTRAFCSTSMGRPPSAGGLPVQRATMMKTDLCPRVTNLPLVAVVEQVFARPRVPDVRAAVVREMSRIFPDTAPLLERVVGLTMPSRGLREIQAVVRAAVE